MLLGLWFADNLTLVTQTRSGKGEGTKEGKRPVSMPISRVSDTALMRHPKPVYRTRTYTIAASGLGRVELDVG